MIERRVLSEDGENQLRSARPTPMAAFAVMPLHGSTVSSAFAGKADAKGTQPRRPHDNLKTRRGWTTIFTLDRCRCYPFRE